MTSKTVVDEFLSAVPGCDVWSADATLDATVLCGGRWPASPLAEKEAADA
jgi:hypothetical protein